MVAHVTEAEFWGRPICATDKPLYKLPLRPDVAALAGQAEFERSVREDAMRNAVKWALAAAARGIPERY